MARYEEVARSLARDIEDATYPVGSKIPTEVELAAAYAVSRSTVRSALDLLGDMGMVSRRRRVGTVVEAARPNTGYARTVTSLNDLVQYSTETRREVLGTTTEMLDDALAEKLGTTPGQQWFHARMLRRTGDTATAICHTDVYLLPEIAHHIGDRINRPEGLISDIIERTTGRITVRVEQRIGACAISPELADVLHARAGSPALEIVRRYQERSGTVGQVTVSVHPSDRFDYVTVMDRLHS